MAGNRSIVELLARTGGKETSWRESSRTIFRPRFMTMMNKDWKKDGGEREWRNRGNRIHVVRGERKEVELCSMWAAKDMGKNMSRRGVAALQEVCQ